MSDLANETKTTQSIQTRETINPIAPPAVAGILSLVIPGLGQILNRQVRRGLLLLAAFLSVAAIIAWRVADLGSVQDEAWEIFSHAVGRRTAFFVLVFVSFGAMWLLTAWDAYRSAKTKRRGSTWLFVAITVAYFALGWQISEINVGRMVSDFPEAWGKLQQVIWPWEAAITYDTDIVSAGQRVLVETEDVEIGEDVEPPPRAEAEADEPYLYTEPTYGRLATQDSAGDTVQGTEIRVVGGNFEPNKLTDIWWQDPIGGEFRPRAGGEYIRVTTDENGSFTFAMNMPYRLVPPSAAGPQYHRIEARQVTEVGPPLPSEPLRLTVGRMVETIIMGLMATFFGIIFSIPISFLAARNIMYGSVITKVIYYLTRTVLNIIRSIEPLIWVLIAVVWVGLGPFAGILALTIHSIAALGKLYSEAIEGIDAGPIEAIQATGATRLQTIIYAVIPQMISPFVSFSIYRWDINVRMSTIIGLVGGGGIGFLLIQYIRLLRYEDAGIAVWFIAITVAILDYVSAEIRNRLV